MNSPKRRDDIFVSVCIPDFVPSNTSDDQLKALISDIESNYDFWELLLVVVDNQTARYEHLLHLGNVRLLMVGSRCDAYRKRSAAVNEAIGDIVVLTAFSEFPFLCISELIRKSNETNSIVIYDTDSSGCLEPVIKSIGVASGYHISTRYLSTTTYPRTLLNQLLIHNDSDLAIRFIPRDGRFPLEPIKAPTGLKPARSIEGKPQRFYMLQKLLLNSAPVFLSFVSLLSIFTVIFSFLYAGYAICSWLILESIQPGWLTTSLALSVTTGFLGISILGISIGVHSVLDRLSPDSIEDIVGDLSSLDLFSSVKNDLNVEVESSLDGHDPKHSSMGDACHIK